MLHVNDESLPTQGFRSATALRRLKGLCKGGLDFCVSMFEIRLFEVLGGKLLLARFLKGQGKWRSVGRISTRWRPNPTSWSRVIVKKLSVFDFCVLVVWGLIPKEKQYVCKQKQRFRKEKQALRKQAPCFPKEKQDLGKQTHSFLRKNKVSVSKNNVFLRKTSFL